MHLLHRNNTFLVVMVSVGGVVATLTVAARFGGERPLYGQATILWKEGGGVKCQYS